MVISSVYNPFFAPSVRVIKSSSRFICLQNLREVDLHVIFCPFQMLLYVYFSQCRRFHRSHNCFDFFQKTTSSSSGRSCFSNMPEKFSASLTCVIHRFMFNSWQRTLGNNPRGNLIGSHTHLRMSSRNLFCSSVISSNYYGYFKYCITF